MTFQECPECYSKPGCPQLCPECLRRRELQSYERVQGYWPAKSSPILYVCDFCENGNHLHGTLSGRCVRVVGGQECQCRIVDVYVHRAKLMQAKDQE